MDKFLGGFLAEFLMRVFQAWLKNMREEQKKVDKVKNDREAEAALDKAQKEYDTTDLQKEIGEKL